MNTDQLKKYYRNSIFAFINVLLVFCSSPVESETANQSTEDIEKQLEYLAIEDLSEDEIEGLIFMREEEKLARDVYIVMYEKWEMKIFNNISQSEQKHMEAIKILFDRYELEDPIENDEIGEFNNEELLNLYNTLITQGNDSLLAALKVGATIEEIDILDLEEQINDKVDNEDILLVYNNLLRGSRNHLRAFVRNIGAQGETYVPQYIEIASYEEIINSEMERGGKGKGNHKSRRGRG
jgi:hypothetical protein